MNIHIKNGIQLPAFDVEMLSQGKLIIVPCIETLKKGQNYLLYPSQKLPYNLSLNQYYQPKYLTSAKAAFDKYKEFPIQLKTWASCEHYERIHSEKKNLLPTIAQSTIWKLSALEHIFDTYEVIKLYMFRVHRSSIAHVVNTAVTPKPYYYPENAINIASENDIPVVNSARFQERKRLLLAGEVYHYKELEDLQLQIELTVQKNLIFKRLNHDIQKFLGLNCNIQNQQPSPDLVWITKIAEVGNSSDGNEFERLVRKSFLKIGFSCSNTNPKANLDPEKLGGPGGVDFYCEYPYPVVGECKATKSDTINDGTPAQLIKLGKNNLQEKYDPCVKIILAGGELNKYALSTAQNNEMNVLTPETLEKLVELQSNYPGCVNLIELKHYLQQEPFGLADDKVNSYISKIKQDIKLRSHIIRAVEELSNQNTENIEVKHKSFTVTEIRTHYNATHNPTLNDKLVYDLLIELSSPLTGYLGRIKDPDWKTDKFYFLRDL